MRFAIWNYAAAVSLASFAVASLGGLFSNIYHYRFNAFYGKPLPPVTSFLLAFYPWALTVPLPWLFAAIWLSRRDAITQGDTLAYAGISTLAIVFLLTSTAIALVLPFVTIVQ